MMPEREWPGFIKGFTEVFRFKVILNIRATVVLWYAVYVIQKKSYFAVKNVSLGRRNKYNAGFIVTN